MLFAMAGAAGAAACPTGGRRWRTASFRAGAIGRALAPSSMAALWTGLPPLLLPVPLATPQVLAVAAAVALFLLIDLAFACRERGSTGTTLALLFAAAVLGAWLGTGPAVLAFLSLVLQLCARLVHPGFTALTVMCRVDAGGLAVGLPCDWPLLLAAGCLASFAAGSGVADTRPVGADVRMPTRRRQVAEAARTALLAAGAGAILAVLGGESRVGLLGPVGALLPAPFLLLAVLRCGQLAFAEAAGSRRLLHDRVIVVAVVGALAALAAGKWIQAAG